MATLTDSERASISTAIDGIEGNAQTLIADQVGEREGYDILMEVEVLRKALGLNSD